MRLFIHLSSVILLSLTSCRQSGITKEAATLTTLNIGTTEVVNLKQMESLLCSKMITGNMELTLISTKGTVHSNELRAGELRIARVLSYEADNDTISYSLADNDEFKDYYSGVHAKNNLRVTFKNGDEPDFFPYSYVKCYTSNDKKIKILHLSGYHIH